jgi:hypothetical protein
MADIVMTPIPPEKVGDRPVMNTGVSMVGLGGDNVFCGHCDREMMHGFDLSKMQVELVYQCGGCDGYNVKPKK